MSDHDPSVPSNGASRDPVTELQNLGLSTDAVESYAREIVGRAVSELGEHIAVSLTLARQGIPATVASSDARAAALDAVQYAHPEGPCLTAIRTGRSVLVDDLAADAAGAAAEAGSPAEAGAPVNAQDTRGDFRALALALGVRSLLCLPLEAGRHPVGSLNLYVQHPHGIGAFEAARAVQVADFASRTLSLVLDLAEQVELTAELRVALRSRTLIDQALGIIMSQRLCDAETAMAILSAGSVDRDVALSVRAAQIRTAAGAPPPPNGHLPPPNR